MSQNSPSVFLSETPHPEQESGNSFPPCPVWFICSAETATLKTYSTHRAQPGPLPVPRKHQACLLLRVLFLAVPSIWNVLSPYTALRAPLHTLGFHVTWLSSLQEMPYLACPWEAIVPLCYPLVRFCSQLPTPSKGH